MGQSTQFIYIEGLNELRRLLKSRSTWVGKPWKDAMTEMAEIGEKVARRNAPYRSGLLESKIYSAVQKKPMPMWVAVRSRAKRRSRGYPRGFAYDRLLEYSPRYGHMGWFMVRIRAIWDARAAPILNKAAREIERKWNWGF